MRRNSLLTSLAVFITAAPGIAAPFGTVVPLVGHAADIALDESRGQLYIANFTANRIEVMSTSDNTVRRSMNTVTQPGGIALSPDSRYLVVTNYSETTSVPAASANQLTVFDLASNTRQTYSTGDAPLAVAFVNTTTPKSGRALIATKTSFYLFDPTNGTIEFLTTYTNLVKDLPVPQATFPGQITQAAMSASGNGAYIWGVGSAGTGSQLVYMYDRDRNQMYGDFWTTTPPLLPRVTAAQDGSWAMIGWAQFTRARCNGPNFMVQSRMPSAISHPNITGHAVDPRRGMIYGQVPDGTQPAGPPFAAGKLPTFNVMDPDNLTVREKIFIPENMTGRALMDKAGSTMYAISDSGIMVLPIGTMNRSSRVSTSVEDVLVQSNFCNRNAMKQTFTISDPGGNRTDFQISARGAGVQVSPTSGTTPATVTVTVDPAAMTNTFGTVAVNLDITSGSAVNVIPPVRLLISNPDQDQRGSVVNIPGTLTDLVADRDRRRFYVVRRDKNQILVFDGTNNQQMAVLRTGTTPRRVALSNDRKMLLVANADSQYVQVIDLDTMQPQLPIELPPGHYARSVAHSNNAAFAVVGNDAAPPGSVDRLDLQSRCAVQPPSLGVWQNKLDPESVLTAPDSRNTILLAETDGNVKLYEAQQDTWVLSRKDLATPPTGGYAASDPQGPPTASLPDSPSDMGIYVVGNTILNPALVPIGTLDASVGNTMGFSFSEAQRGYRLTGNTASGPGVIQNMPALRVAPGSLVRPVRVTEAPILPTKEIPFTRTVDHLPAVGTVLNLTTSGVTVLAGAYDAPIAPPTIASVVNAADGNKPVAPGGLISIYGTNMAPTNQATSQMPLPTALGQSCLVVNGMLAPLLFVSGSQVNAQLPARVSGTATMTIHTPGGVSDNYNFSASSTAPSVFQTGSPSASQRMATVVRASNGELVTPTNPIHTDDTVVIYLTGLGATVPAVEDGMPAPSAPLATAAVQPVVSLGGKALNVYWAGLVPGYVGLYQINATVPFGVPQGLDIPLTIDQNGNSTTLSVRVVK
jgi:uncharacterized protein (TIGR03437 family)